MSEKMVASTTMYCAEQIVIPEKISNLLKTYAKAALKTQPYDLLRWSAAYFRCLSDDELPPVKVRYEMTSSEATLNIENNVFGCLTRGYLKVLMNQVGNGYFVRRDILEHRWCGLTLPEDELLKFLSITRMLYWPQLHWLKLISVMVGSLNQNFLETMSMLCELLTDSPEGGSCPVPLWLFRECFKFLAELDCSESQTFFDGRKVISADGNLESETRMQNVPQKLSSISFRNAVIDYWKHRIENADQEKKQQQQQHDLVEETTTVDENENEKSNEKSFEEESKPKLRSTSSITRDGSDFRIVGDFKDPHEIIKCSLDFESIIGVIQKLKIDDDDVIHAEMSDEQREKIAQQHDKVAELREKLSNNLMDDFAKSSIENEFYELLREIGPPWNWLFNFVNSHDERSFNFFENSCVKHEGASGVDELQSLDEGSVVKSEEKSTTTISEASGICISLQQVDEEHDEDEESGISHHHRVLVETICNISGAFESGECDIRDNSSISCYLDEQNTRNQLTPSDYSRLKKFIDNAQERGLVFNDLNELYNYFIQESFRERRLSHNIEDDAGGRVLDVEIENLSAAVDELSSSSQQQQFEVETEESKNVVAIFGESGIEVDGKLLEAKVSDRMILGLVDKGSDDNLSDVASSVSSVSHAETVKMKNNVTRERNTQTVSYREQIHSRRMQNKQHRKSKSASSIKRQPFVCKIPPLPGIGSAMDADKIDQILRFITHRSFQQGGFVYPRNLHENDLQSIIMQD